MPPTDKARKGRQCSADPGDILSLLPCPPTAFKMKKVTPPWWDVRGLLFSSIFKSIIMTYIVKERKQLKIITVRVDQEDFFQADYAGRILASGNNTMQALLKFGELPNLSQLNDDLNQEKSPE